MEAGKMTKKTAKNAKIFSFLPHKIRIARIFGNFNLVLSFPNEFQFCPPAGGLSFLGAYHQNVFFKLEDLMRYRIYFHFYQHHQWVFHKFFQVKFQHQKIHYAKISK
jgi:hypothetical protein